MAFMRSTLAYALLWLNLIFTFLILFFFARISPKPKDLDRILLYINLSAFVPILMLIFSFCVTKNECCSTDKEVNEGFAIGSCFGLCLCCGSNCLADKPRNQVNQVQQGHPNQNPRRKKDAVMIAEIAEIAIVEEVEVMEKDMYVLYLYF